MMHMYSRQKKWEEQMMRKVAKQEYKARPIIENEKHDLLSF